MYRRACVVWDAQAAGWQLQKLPCFFGNRPAGSLRQHRALNAGPFFGNCSLTKANLLFLRARCLLLRGLRFRVLWCCFPQVGLLQGTIQVAQVASAPGRMLQKQGSHLSTLFFLVRSMILSHLIIPMKHRRYVGIGQRYQWRTAFVIEWLSGVCLKTLSGLK